MLCAITLEVMLIVHGRFKKLYKWKTIIFPFVFAVRQLLIVATRYELMQGLVASL